MMIFVSFAVKLLAKKTVEFSKIMQQKEILLPPCFRWFAQNYKIRFSYLWPPSASSLLPLFLIFPDTGKFKTVLGVKKKEYLEQSISNWL